MRTKRRAEAPRAEGTINLVGCDAVLCERVRASLRRGPLACEATPRPLPPDRVDIYAVPAALLEEVCRRGAPVIAWGAAATLRGAFLAGCDDFLREPWSPEELEMRALAVLGRLRAGLRLPWGDASLEGSVLRSPAGSLSLTRHEALILRTLLRFRGGPVTRDALSLVASGHACGQSSRAVDVHIACIRRKIRALAPGAGRAITCVRGQGYMIP